jgi:hypothetical protein
VSDRDAALAALGENRRLLTAISLGSGVVGLIPIPLVGELATDLLRAFLVQRLGARRGVEISRRISLTLIGADRASLSRLALGASLALAARMLWRRLTRVLFVLLRFDDMGRTFLLGTTFDYYLVVHHPAASDGATRPPLEEAQAAALQRAISAAASQARPEVMAALFRRVSGDLLRAGASLPRTMLSLLAKVLRRSETAPEEAERVVEEDLDGLFARATRLLDAELRALGHSVVLALCEAFDRAWDAERPPATAPAAPPADPGAPR